jgi:hypothetical protein
MLVVVVLLHEHASSAARLQVKPSLTRLAL